MFYSLNKEFLFLVLNDFFFKYTEPHMFPMCILPLTEVLGGGPSIRRFHGGSPWLAKSLIFR